MERSILLMALLGIRPGRVIGAAGVFAESAATGERSRPIRQVGAARVKGEEAIVAVRV